MKPLFHDYDRLVKYLAGDLSAEDRIHIELQLAEVPEYQKIVDELRNAQDVMQRQGKEEIAFEAAALRHNLETWARLQTNQHFIGQHSPERPHPVPAAGSVREGTFLAARYHKARWTTRPRVRALVAAVGVCALLIGGGVLYRASTAISASSARSVYSTPNGQRATLSLPDGSFAVLNVGSRLEVPANFSAGHREVRLTGEAMFTVKHHEGSPFTVTTGSSHTRVLGTEFLVRRYKTDTVTTVAVKSGKVAVQSAIVTARREATVLPNGTVSLGAFHPSQFDFIHGTLTLDNVTLSDAVVELGRWYDADIRIGDASLRTQRVGGKFVSGSRTELASILEAALGFRVVQHGRTLTLYEE